MIHTGHSIVKCDCGEIISQCRCYHHTKPVIIEKKGCDACKAGKKGKDKK